MAIKLGEHMPVNSVKSDPDPAEGGLDKMMSMEAPVNQMLPVLDKGNRRKSVFS